MLRKELDLKYDKATFNMISKFKDYKLNQGLFSITLDAQTATNQQAYLKITRIKLVIILLLLLKGAYIVIPKYTC